MRFHEIVSGVRVPVSSEEQEILRKTTEGPLRRDGLDERQKEVARTMVRRGLLTRSRTDGAVVFTDTVLPLRRD